MRRGMDHDEVFVDLTDIVDQRLAAGAGSAASAVTGFVYGDPPEAPGVDAATRACIERLAIGSQVGVPATRGLCSLLLASFGKCCLPISFLSAV